MNPTIRDIATAADVHFATVSRALRGDPRIPATTRERVCAVAASAGYVRDPAYRALTARRAPAAGALRPERIALLSNRSPVEGFRRYTHYRSIELGVRRQASDLGYECETLFVDRDHHDSKSLLGHLRRRGVSGLVCATLEAGRRAVELPWDEFSVVAIDSGELLPEFTFISVDQFHYTQLAFHRLRELGYRRIGLVVEHEGEQATGDLHRAALLLAQAAVAEAERVPALLISRKFSTPEVAAAVAPWLIRERVDAVISNQVQVRQFAGSVACATLCMHAPMPGLAGVLVSFAEVGRRAVSLLTNLMQTGQRGVSATPTRTYVAGVWRDGSSAPPVVDQEREAQAADGATKRASR